MPDPKTYWTIIEGSPTECTIEEPFGGRVVVHPLSNPDATVTVLWGFVFDDKKICIQRTLDRLAEDVKEHNKNFGKLISRHPASRRDYRESQGAPLCQNLSL